MKKIILLSAGAVALAILSTSCKHADEGHVSNNGIDSLQKVLTSYETLFSEINVNEVETIITTIDTDIDSAAAICEKKKLSLTPEDGTFFGRYQALKSGLRKFGTRYNDIKEELAHSKHQLSTLKADTEAGKFDEEAQSKYFHDESAAVKNLGQAIEQIQGASVTVTGQFKSLRPQYLARLVRLEQKRY
ncbi:MAG: hypothetical protein V4616_12385 [Bacteroidota bacterium]